MACWVCKKRPVDVAHIQSRGAGGSDHLENLMPLCRAHHQEQHQIGIKSFAQKYDLPLTFEHGYPRKINP